MVEDSKMLREVSSKIRELIMSAEMPRDLAEAIQTAYHQLAAKVGETGPWRLQGLKCNSRRFA